MEDKENQETVALLKILEMGAQQILDGKYIALEDAIAHMKAIKQNIETQEQICFAPITPKLDIKIPPM